MKLYIHVKLSNNGDKDLEYNLKYGLIKKINEHNFFQSVNKHGLYAIRNVGCPSLEEN